jgi:hypothetical protein
MEEPGELKLNQRLADGIAASTTGMSTPLMLPFLLLRLQNYNPATLTPYRQLIEIKLARLQQATCAEAYGSYLKDLRDVLQQPNHHSKRGTIVKIDDDDFVVNEEEESPPIQ